MKVLFYGRLADVFGRELELAAPSDCSIAELRSQVAAKRPNAAEALQNMRVRACIGDSIVPEDRTVAPGDVVEFFPPVSGG